MFVLDTDTVSHLQRPGTAVAARVLARVRSCGRPVVATTVSFEEQLRGRMAACAATRTPEDYVFQLRQLRETIEDYRERTVLDFDDRAAAQFKKLKAAKIRVGTMDLRIAGITLAHSATLVTANLSDFRKVPGLTVEDWTKPALGS